MPCLNTSRPNHAFKKHEKSTRHTKLEVESSSNEASVYYNIIIRAEKINLNKRHTNQFYLQKCIHTIYFMIQKNITLSDLLSIVVLSEKFHSRKISRGNYKTLP